MKSRRLWRWTLTHLSVALLWVCGAAAQAGVSDPPEEPAPIEVRQTTSITWSGTAGARLLVPAGVKLAEEDMEVATTGKYVLAGISHGPCEGLCFFQEILGLSEIMIPPAKMYTSVFAQPDGSIAAGMNHVYLLTDGTATLTLNFQGAPVGNVEANATHSIISHVQEIDSSCDLGPACQDLRYGGATRTLDEGWAGIVAYAGSDGAPDPFVNPGSAFAKACVSPEHDDPGGAPQPQQHGCRLIDGSDPDGTVVRMGDLLVGNSWVDGPNMVSFGTNFNAQGAIYLGYQNRQTGVQTQGEEYQRNIAFWIEKGLRWDP